MPHLEKWVLSTPYFGRVREFNKDKNDYLRGIITGHHLCQDGHEVITSPVMEFDPIAKTAVTYSGTHYTLGAIHPDYEKWLKEQEALEHKVATSH